MAHLLYTDFIKNRFIQTLAFLGLLMDLNLFHSVEHIGIFLGLPYVFSIGLNLVLQPKKIIKKARVSAQYKKRDGME